MKERKHPRLKEYDYSQPGYYYVTIHTENEQFRLSQITQGTALQPTLTALGRIAQEQLFALESRYPYVRIDKYVIMPTHIHVIVRLIGEAAPEHPRPGIPDIICAYKSLTTRISNQMFRTPGRKLFQTSFFEMVLRNEKAYQECWRYIEENPAKWLLKHGE